MIRDLRPALVLGVLLAVITGLVYPLALTGVTQVLFPRQANGSLIVKNGTIVGSELIGQRFAADRYFHGRPSATNAPDPADASKTVDAPYNAANSMGSNLGPSNKALVERVSAEVALLRAENPSAAVPIDLVTTSASGLDPHISPAAALFQVPRIARARGLAPRQLEDLVAQATEAPVAGIFGERVVNVLKLNLALDSLGK